MIKEPKIFSENEVKSIPAIKIFDDKKNIIVTIVGAKKDELEKELKKIRPTLVQNDDKLIKSVSPDIKEETINGKNQDSEIKEIVGSDIFVESLQNAKNNSLVVKFYSKKCPACEMFIPTFEEFSASYSDCASFAQVNVDDEKNNELSKKYSIESIPITIIFKDSENKEELRVLKR